MESRDHDYYKLLEVQCTATDIEIRRAYLQQSRRWHPDKAQQNGITAKEATTQFQLISVANETLSDPRLRKSYDRRREQPRRQQAQDFGGFGSTFFNCWFNPRPTQSDFYHADSAPSNQTPMSTGEVWKAFVSGRISEAQFTRHTRSCFSDFEDGPSGFYEVFDKLFKKKIFAAENASTSDTCCSSPMSPDFGIATTVWKSGPGPFYKYWSRFRTTQKLGSADGSSTKCSSSSGSKQAQRSQAKKQQKATYDLYNGKVHTLVDLLQALDPRVKAEERRLENRAEEQHLENAAKLQAERAQRQEALRAERAARQRSQEEEDEDDDSAESDEDSGHLGSGVIFVVTPDGVAMTCEQAIKYAAQDAAERGGQVHDSVLECDAQEAKDDSRSCDGVVEGEADIVEEEEQDNVGSGDEDASVESSESEPEVYRCEACRKYFKHVNQYESHLASKKHKKEHSAWLEQMKKK